MEKISDQNLAYAWVVALKKSSASEEDFLVLLQNRVASVMKEYRSAREIFAAQIIATIKE